MGKGDGAGTKLDQDQKQKSRSFALGVGDSASGNVTRAFTEVSEVGHAPARRTVREMNNTTFADLYVAGADETVEERAPSSGEVV